MFITIGLVVFIYRTCFCKEDRRESHDCRLFFYLLSSSVIKTMTAPTVWQSCLRGVWRWYIATQYNKLQRQD